jgi:preprotein translocase subunit SecE
VTPSSAARPANRGAPAEPFSIGKRLRQDVAKVSPGEFIRQVRAETAKVVWPTRKETVTTAIMVLIMTAMLALFFFGVDSVFSAIVKFLLGSLS